MDRVCPRCRGTTPHRLCPQCGIRTIGVAGAMPTVGGEVTSPATALLIGILLAQGLYFSLLHLVTAGLLAANGPHADGRFFDTLNGLITQHVLQGLALLAGGMFAAAGQRRGLLIGTALGLVNALLLIGLQHLLRGTADELTWFGQPLLHAFVGAAGGVIGSRIWRPAPELPPLAGDGRIGGESLSTVLPDQPVDVMVEPWPWSQICLGVVVAIGGTLGARFIREFVVMAGGGTGREMQSQFITWEIALVAQVIGGVIAGARTRGGVLYGFWVGLSAAIVLAAVQSIPALQVPAQTVPAWLAGGAPGEGDPAVLAIQSAQVVLLGALGGWLGGLILPADPGRREYDGR